MCDGNRTHRISLADRRLILNPGSVGQPRDGDPRASYAMYDPDEGHVTLHRTPYDIETVQHHMREVGLPSVLADRLAEGALNLPCLRARLTGHCEWRIGGPYFIARFCRASRRPSE